MSLLISAKTGDEFTSDSVASPVMFTGHPGRLFPLKSIPYKLPSCEPKNIPFRLSNTESKRKKFGVYVRNKSSGKIK